MKVCTKCWSITCDYRNKVTIDNDLADFIIALNKEFIRLKWDIKTLFCCSGHYCSEEEFEIFGPYIMFEGAEKFCDFMGDGFVEFFEAKNLTGFTFDASYFPVDEDFYHEPRFSMGIASDKACFEMTLENKLECHKVRQLFLEFLKGKIDKLSLQS